MNDYPIELEPAMTDWLKENLKKYHPNENFTDELYNLIEKYTMYICCDKIKDFEVTNEQKERLIELLLDLSLSLSSKPVLYEDEYNYMKKYWHPDWEICYGCSKKFTYKCDKSKCNPLDI